MRVIIPYGERPEDEGHKNPPLTELNKAALEVAKEVPADMVALFDPRSGKKMLKPATKPVQLRKKS